MLTRKSFLIAAQLFVACAQLFVASPARAQQSVVEKAKADLAAAGVQVENKACTDFEIAKVVAGRVPGAGLLTKDCCGDANDPNRSHCEFNGVWYAHDIISFVDGSLVDIAQDGGGANGPTWQLSPPDPALVSRYRSAASLGLTGAVAGAPVPVPTPNPGPVTPPVTPDLEPLKAQMSALMSRVAVLEQKLAEASVEIETLHTSDQAFSVLIVGLQDQLKALKLPTGCRVQFLACRLTP